MENLKIVYEDNDILVVDKPAGMTVEGGKVGEKDLESECRNYLKKKGERPEILVIHRLDKPVSGLIVLAKNTRAAAELTRQITDGDMHKQYSATVFKGPGFKPSAELKDYLLKDTGNNLSRVVSAGTKGAKEAVLSYETVCEDDMTATLLVDLKTGRHHQIRVQLSHAGFPILGDRKYGNAESIEYSGKAGIKDVALRAVKLSFDHPVTGESMTFSAEQP